MDNKNKKQVIIGVTALLLVTLTLLGLTYAYYRTRIIGNTNDKSVSVTSKKLEVVYADGNGTIEANQIEPGYTATKTFTVKNTGDDTVSYGIKLDNITNTFERYEDWTFSIKKGETVIKEGTVPLSESYIVNTISIASNVTDEYTLEVTYANLTDVDQSIDMGQNLSFRVNIADATGEIFESASEGTLLKAIGNDKLISSPLSIPGQQESGPYNTGGMTTETVNTSSLCAEYHSWLVGDTESAAQSGSTVSSYEEAVGKYVYDQCPNRYWTKKLIAYDSETSTLTFEIPAKRYEKVLSSTEDDYGTSYYFRGVVDNNYVTFAGMCWRIVRIAGDGSTKLILEDQDEVCRASMNGNWDISTGNYGYEEKNVNSDSFNEEIMNYLNPVTNADKSMVKAFYDFQKDKLADYTEKLKAGDWCLGDKAYTVSGSKPNYTYTPLDEYNYSSYMSYDSYVRLSGKNKDGYQPTLKCTGTILSNFESVTYNETEIIEEAPMYVGAITADEIVYAGGKYDSSDENYYYYYLTNNYQTSNGKGFLSLSPTNFNNSTDTVFFVFPAGDLGNIPIVMGGSDIRPSVSLASSAVVTSGDGTIDAPYVIG